MRFKTGDEFWRDVPRLIFNLLIGWLGIAVAYRIFGRTGIRDSQLLYAWLLIVGATLTRKPLDR